jgi:hypothetical protein
MHSRYSVAGFAWYQTAACTLMAQHVKRAPVLASVGRGYSQALFICRAQEAHHKYGAVLNSIAGRQ